MRWRNNRNQRSAPILQSKVTCRPKKALSARDTNMHHYTHEIGPTGNPQRQKKPTCRLSPDEWLLNEEMDRLNAAGTQRN